MVERNIDTVLVLEDVHRRDSYDLFDVYKNKSNLGRAIIFHFPSYKCASNSYVLWGKKEEETMPFPLWIYMAPNKHILLVKEE
ncbi:hypothetical protein POVCU1_012510 [Plasmodium ovale curtisi]|uniref:Uncharacterized protein n=1 Tax=Plasmodium ovale curtisi TaxID=864141 RepID=A0A1A8W2T0_PLAOA|nr:hypothetical protein POVCU1_012510 [Plasmodium ovale curtisi]